jgi:hypothetical protein
MASSFDPLAFSKMIPGFDFMRQFTEAAAQYTSTPNMTGWITPTVSIEEIDKRIADLKAVLFWMEQNGHVLRATMQALEVQKMTLTTLQSMNVNLADLAKSFPTTAQAVTQPAATQETQAPVAKPEVVQPAVAPQQPVQVQAAEPDPVQDITDENKDVQEESPNTQSAVATALNPSLQLWNVLTQQFQNIASTALGQVAKAAQEMPAMANQMVAAASNASDTEPEAPQSPQENEQASFVSEHQTAFPDTVLRATSKKASTPKTRAAKNTTPEKASKTGKHRE